mgnify:CR=1 FL=1
MTDLTPPPPPDLPRPDSPRRPWVRRAIIGFLVVANIAIFGGLAAVWFAADKVADEIGTVEGDLDLDASPGSNDPVTFLLVGSDSREGVPEDFTNMGSFGGQRADVVMLVKIWPGDTRVQMVSLPRDLKVTYKGRGQRINAAFNDGPAGLLEAVRDVTPEPIHHYLQVNFAGFAGIVDAIGGVKMTFPYPARDKKSGLSVPAGTHTLDGQQALQFARSRKYQEFRDGSWVYVRSSDIGRTGRQQDLLMAIITQVDRPGSIGEFTDLVNALGGFVESDDQLNADDIIQLGWSMRNVSAADIDAITLPVKNSLQNGVAYVVQIEPDATQVLAALRDGDPFRESVAGSAVVEVQNGNGVAGSAGAVADVIGAGGYEVDGITNSDREDYPTTLVVARPRNLPQAEAIVDLLGYGQASVGATPNGIDVLVIVGGDAAS